MEFTRAERNRGIYIIGKTRSGKTTFLEHMILADVHAGRGVVFLDPHGQASHNILDRLPLRRVEETCFMDFSDKEGMVGFNPVIQPHHMVTALIGIYGEKVSDRAKYYLLHGLQLIKENSHLTILDLPRIYYDKDFREAQIDTTTDIATRNFWTQEYPSFSTRYNEEAPATILNKLGQFAASAPIRAALTQKKPKFDFESAMRFNQIVVINIAKGTIGPEAANLVGSLILSHLHSILFEGAISECNLYVDEFQSFGTALIADMLSEDAKWGLHATLANQYFSQLPETNQDAILGNIGTIVAFRIGSKDADLIAAEMNDMNVDYSRRLRLQPRFHALIHQENRDPYQILPQPPTPSGGTLKRAIDASRRRFARRIENRSPRTLLSTNHSGL
jgi:hypothetical protein